MSKKQIITGIDIGSSAIKTVIAEYGEDQMPRVIGVGSTPSVGVRRGVVVDVAEAATAIDASIDQAERMANVQIQGALVSIGGSDLNAQSAKGVVAIGRADGEVVDDDVERVVKAAQSVSVPVNTEIIHVMPRSFRLDDQENIKDPIGMKGVRLEVDAMIIETPSTQMKSLMSALEKAAVEVEDIIIAPLSASTSVLESKQKELGVAVVDIGAGTTSLSVFEEGDMIHTAVLPVGSGYITNDIAIGLRTSIDIAEKIKMIYGTALISDVQHDQVIDLSQIDSSEDGHVSHYHVVEIITARLEEIFQMVHNELRAVKRDRLLPAGIVVTGGGANLPHMIEFAKEYMKLPLRLGVARKGMGGIVDKVDQPEFAVALGLIAWEHEHGVSDTARFAKGSFVSGIAGSVGEKFSGVRGWFGKFLP